MYAASSVFKSTTNHLLLMKVLKASELVAKAFQVRRRLSALPTMKNLPLLLRHLAA